MSVPGSCARARGRVTFVLNAFFRQKLVSDHSPNTDMPAYRSRSEELIPLPRKPSQRKTVALPFEEPQDAFVLPDILSQVYSSTEYEGNALGLSGLYAPTMDTTDDLDIGTLVTGVAAMMPTTIVQVTSPPTSPRSKGRRHGARALSTLSPITFSSSSSRYLGRTGNTLIGQLLGAVTPPLSPTHGGPITTVNFS